jgi:hypothetical protein
VYQYFFTVKISVAKSANKFEWSLAKSAYSVASYRISIQKKLEREQKKVDVTEEQQVRCDVDAVC